ncbi:hypothetical protein CDEST_02011 [Colletotrichum destructivum]|uniref:Uncharacterized protein n=1 Tax=Colletotrichum destructivum TaxID=34406 RepID=A0AAX4I1K1_9PEZI|nr:hypothetical protein CDEST_02011 [Colletotrichum destructivum]
MATPSAFRPRAYAFHHCIPLVANDSRSGMEAKPSHCQSIPIAARIMHVLPSAQGLGPAVHKTVTFTMLYRTGGAQANVSKPAFVLRNRQRRQNDTARTQRSAINLDVFGIHPRLLLLISLNWLPYVASTWSDQLFEKQISSVAFKTIVLLCIDDLQESLVLFLQPLFDNVAFDVLSGEDDTKSRRLIMKADSFTTVVRVCTIKLPSVAVTLVLILPKTMVSMFVCILAPVIWYSVFLRAAKTVQDEKLDRDDALSEKEPEAEEYQGRYLRSLSCLLIRLLSWSVTRNGCLFLFAFFSPGLDPTLMTRCVHQVAALETVMLKFVQSYQRARNIVQVLFKNKLPNQSNVAAVIDRLRAGSNRSCVCRTAVDTCCIGRLYDTAQKSFRAGPLLPVAHGYCHNSRTTLSYREVGTWVTEKLRWSFETIGRCSQRPGLIAAVQEYRPLLAANMPRCACTEV